MTQGNIESLLDTWQIHKGNAFCPRTRLINLQTRTSHTSIHGYYALMQRRVIIAPLCATWNTKLARIALRSQRQISWNNFYGYIYTLFPIFPDMYTARHATARNVHSKTVTCYKFSVFFMYTYRDVKKT
jgi:hypothetical protein